MRNRWNLTPSKLASYSDSKKKNMAKHADRCLSVVHKEMKRKAKGK